MSKIPNIFYNRTDTWPSIDEIQKYSKNDLADFAELIFLKGILGEINRVMTTSHDGKPPCGGVGHIVFISLCVALDAIARFYIPYKKNAKLKAIHKNFISKFFSEKYKTLNINTYGYFRCDSVHAWTLHRISINSEKEYINHLKLHDKILEISLFDFYCDLKDAVAKYINKLKNDDGLKENFINRYSDLVNNKF